MKLAQIAVLTALFAIVALTVVPADERLVTGLGQSAEHFLCFAIVGLAVPFAFPASIKQLLSASVLFALAIELLNSARDAPRAIERLPDRCVGRMHRDCVGAVHDELVSEQTRQQLMVTCCRRNRLGPLAHRDPYGAFYHSLNSPDQMRLIGRPRRLARARSAPHLC